MQPQGAAARAAAALATADTLVLLPFGNDGVGVPGPFIATAPDALRVLLIGAGAGGARSAAVPNPVAASEALRSEPRLILARVAADDASRAAVSQAQAYFQNDPCWQLQQQTKLVAVYLNRCPHQQP